MLFIENISYSTHGKTIIDNVSLQIKNEQINLIIGPNGAGKSTLIKLISGLIPYQNGQITYNENHLKHISISDLSKIRAVLSQHLDIAFPLSVKEVVMMGRYPFFKNHPATSDEKICEEVMKFFDVWDFSERKYITLSGGEKQRVHFARVITQIWDYSSSNPRYLFLDEPLTFLDIRYQFDFMNKIKTLIKLLHLTVIGVVHDLNIAAKYADHLIIINQGKLVEEGIPNQILTKENIKNVFGLEPIIKKENDQLLLFFS